MWQVSEWVREREREFQEHQSQIFKQISESSTVQFKEWIGSFRSFKGGEKITNIQ